MNPQILVIDDESVTRRLVKFTLRSLNIDVIEAEDARSGLEAARQSPPALVLIDINLPDVDGFGLFEQLRALEGMEDVPMILFTARNDPHDETRALAMGASGLLYKPFSTQELRDLVSAHLA